MRQGCALFILFCFNLFLIHHVHFPGRSVYYGVVDIFNATSGKWSTASLSVGRDRVASASLPDFGIAIFSGGHSKPCDGFICCLQCVVFEQSRTHRSVLIQAFLMLCAAAGGVVSSVVDIFNAIAATWTTAALSVSRGFLSATSLPNVGVALFAGGAQGGTQCDLNLSVCRTPYLAKERVLAEIVFVHYIMS